VAHPAAVSSWSAPQLQDALLKAPNEYPSKIHLPAQTIRYQPPLLLERCVASRDRNTVCNWVCGKHFQKKSVPTPKQMKRSGFIQRDSPPLSSVDGWLPDCLSLRPLSTSLLHHLRHLRHRRRCPSRKRRDATMSKLSNADTNLLA